MGTAASLIFFTAGAVLAFAVRQEPASIDLHAVGVIIMLASMAHFAWAVYRERWRRRVVEESIEHGNGIPPIPVDETVIVDPVAPVEGPHRVYPHQEHSAR
jgi:hypothetical protein